MVSKIDRANLTIETLQFSDKIDKYSRFINKSRILAITKKTVYNLSGAKIKKRIPIKTIVGVSKLVTKDRKHEIVIHSYPVNHDYYFLTNQ